MVAQTVTRLGPEQRTEGLDAGNATAAWWPDALTLNSSNPQQMAQSIEPRDAADRLGGTNTAKVQPPCHLDSVRAHHHDA